MNLRRASSGAIVCLGQLIGRGGEGTVHAVVGAPKLVAKIYLKPPNAAKVEKLRVMSRGHSRELLNVAAWPVDLLLDDQGVVRGFLMGRISARQDAHRLYSPKSRRRTFPDADFRFVVRAATNLARAFAQIHAREHVIGDVNHGNALIGKDGTAALIDCDSIQVRDQGRTFTCDVGTPLFTPPELQGKTFRGLKRAESHDRFGLAVLIFHLLFQGRHPFAGVFAEGDMPIERAITESRFAYGASAAAMRMTPPPGTLALETFGPRIEALFERAFAPPTTAERPSAIEWIEALQELEHGLAGCLRRPRHFHPGGASCCWCAVEAHTGAKLFDDGQSTPDADAMTATELWKAIEGVHPPVDLPLPKFAEPLEKALAGPGPWSRILEGLLGNLESLFAGGIVLVLLLSPLVGIPAALGFIALMVSGGIAASVHGRRSRKSRPGRGLRIEWERAVAEWRNHSARGLFASARSELERSRRTLDELAFQQRNELERLERLLEPRQRQTFLDVFEIGSAQFLVVAPSHVEKLASRGVRSAGDLSRRRGRLKGLVPKNVLEELRMWAAKCTQNFKFDKRDAVYLEEAAKIEEKYRRQRELILEVLRRGPALLAAKRAEVANARARAEDVLRQKHEHLLKRRDKVNE